MTYTQIDAAIYNYVSANVGGITVIWSDENRPRPGLPYITLSVINYGKIGMVDQGTTDGSGNQDRCYNEDVSLSVQGYGRGSKDNLQTLKDSFSTETGRLALEAQDLSLRDDESIRSVGVPIDENMEPRWLYEITMGVAQLQTENVSYIETTTIEGTISGGKNPAVRNITITAP